MVCEQRQGGTVRTSLNERDLITLGFTPHGNGSLTTPGRITFTPTGADFYHVTIVLPGGDVLSCYISRLALKISKGEKT